MTARDEVLTGGRELDRLLQTLPGKMQKNINRAALRAGAAVLLPEVRQNIPVASGNLRKTARISTRAKGAEVSASVKVGGKHKGVDAWYAFLVEFGTRRHKILPKKQGGVMQFGGIKTRMVDHPGTAARPFMRPAVDAKFPEVIAAVTAKIRERLSAQGLDTPAPLPADPAE